MLRSPELKTIAPPAAENHLHYKGLNGLRGVAVLMVLVQHYIVLAARFEWGWIGVRIFFVLSGFLITGILYDTRNAERRWSVFYARRALRIFPLYYGVLLLGVLLYPFFRWVIHPSYVLWPLYLQNFSRFIWPGDISSGVVDHLRSTRFTNPQFFLFYGHFWSLAVEEQFYLIWPLVVFAVKRRETLIKICAAVIVLSPIARLICCFALSRTLIVAGFEERFTFLQCDALLLGALFALWMRGPHPDLTRLGKWLLWGLLAVIVVSEILCSRLYGRALEPAIGDPIFASIGFTCVNLGSMALVLLAIDPTTWLSRFLEIRGLRWLGTISYGFYVFHDMPHFLYNVIVARLGLPNPRNVGNALVGLIGTLILASLSFYGFERPILRLKRYFTVRETRYSPQFREDKGRSD